MRKSCPYGKLLKNGGEKKKKPPGRKRGRKTIFIEENVERILQAIGQGQYENRAIFLVPGLSINTWNAWKYKKLDLDWRNRPGRRTKKGEEIPPEKINITQAILKAKSVGEAYHLGIVTQAAANDWRASRFWLRTQFKAEYAFYNVQENRDNGQAKKENLPPMVEEELRKLPLRDYRNILRICTGHGVNGKRKSGSEGA